MKYFFDTEFHEYKRRWNEKEVGHGYSVDHPQSCDTIDLISIGIVSEDNRTYYAICKQFDVDKAWSNEWLRKNVLFPIHNELAPTTLELEKEEYGNSPDHIVWFKYLIESFGLSKQQIANDIFHFVTVHTKCISKEGEEFGDVLYYTLENEETEKWKKEHPGFTQIDGEEPQFYAYYADYDWVVFCWLYGRMIDLPNNYPMYCRDLKQSFDDIVEFYSRKTEIPVDLIAEAYKNSSSYPKQENEHNALDDAKWNKNLYDFIQKL